MPKASDRDKIGVDGNKLKISQFLKKLRVNNFQTIYQTSLLKN